MIRSSYEVERPKGETNGPLVIHLHEPSSLVLNKCESHHVLKFGVVILNVKKSFDATAALEGIWVSVPLNSSILTISH